MVFGAGKLQASLLDNIKKMGFTSVAVDIDPQPFSRYKADYFYCIPDNNLQELIGIALKHKIKGIATTSLERPLPIMAELAQVLNVPFPERSSIERSINKKIMKDCFLDHDIPCADGYLVKPTLKIEKPLLKYPLIVKPSDSSGSRGVLKCTNDVEYFDAINIARGYSKTGEVMVEVFIEGDEISVECLVFRGECKIIQITDKITSLSPFNVEITHIQPSKYSSLHYNEIKRISQEIATAFHLDMCAMHIEAKVNDTGTSIIEFGPRLGGDYITSHLTPISTGVNIEQEYLRICTGTPPKYNKSQSQASAVVFINMPTNSTLTNGDFQDILDNEHVVDFNIELVEGDHCPQLTNSLDRYGHVILKGDTRDEIDKEIVQIQHSLRKHFLI